MPRWPPGSLERLEEAALDLFASQGYEETTVADIAARAGLKERSFYRYFPDKRDVLFAGTDSLTENLSAAIKAMPEALPPFEAMIGALPAAENAFRPRNFVRRRREVIAASPALAERELIKLADLSQLLSTSLIGRGAERETAELCAGIGLAIMRQASERWVDGEGTYAELVADAAETLRGLMSRPT